MNWEKQRLYLGAANLLWMLSNSLDSVIEAAYSLFLIEEDIVRKTAKEGKERAT
jgi:hypothetical protein